MAAAVVTLKAFQRRVLARLRRFCDQVSGGTDPALAFADEGLAPYRPAPLIAAPCVCFAIPTGGGKTLLAAAAAGVIAAHALRRVPGLVVWLVPSNAIAEQTLRQLRNVDHAVAQAASGGIDGFGGLGAVRVVDVAQALRLPPSTYHATSVILVATIQQFRISDPQGRQVYLASDALDDDGAHTLAEVISRRRPVVIVDEAHNARTPLSFETLARLSPGFVLELTATPARQPWPSNVLIRVDAAALKAEQLLKLPLVLATDPDAERCLAGALACRLELAQAAAAETAVDDRHVPLRPLLLIQAEARRHPGALTPEVVREHLITRAGLAPEAIAIATGEQRGLEGVDLDDPRCPLTTIITVEALREGWDCPAAAVLCTLRGGFTDTAAVQLVGRILRQPGASLRAHPLLNRSFAFAVAPAFDAALAALRGCLVDGLGFGAEESLHLVQAAGRPLASEQAEPSPPFLVPRLLVRDPLDPARWEPFRDTHRLASDWPLPATAARLSPGEYQPGAAGPGLAEVDLDADGAWSAVELAVAEGERPPTTRTALGAWLERRLWADDIRPDDLGGWVAQALDHLLERRALSLADLDHDRWRLAAVLRERLDLLREQAVRAATDRALAGDQMRVSAVDGHFRFSSYPADGASDHGFLRHAFPLLAAFDSAEERQAATILDRHPRVARWVRNPVGDHGFALPRRPLDGNRWFYPDLIAELGDGRLLVVEVKGAHLANTVDTQDKVDIASRWAHLTGHGFVLVVGGDVAAIQEALG